MILHKTEHMTVNLLAILVPYAVNVPGCGLWLIAGKTFYGIVKAYLIIQVIELTGRKIDIVKIDFISFADKDQFGMFSF